MKTHHWVGDSEIESALLVPQEDVDRRAPDVRIMVLANLAKSGSKSHFPHHELMECHRGIRLIVDRHNLFEVILSGRQTVFDINSNGPEILLKRGAVVIRGGRFYFRGLPAPGCGLHSGRWGGNVIGLVGQTVDNTCQTPRSRIDLDLQSFIAQGERFAPQWSMKTGYHHGQGKA
ncbi:MAG TPA: hypothetical protein PLS90_15545, partial [Candidatus Sumerlaeota bacterium]|nr:hypothetical protein [Candidatus Sumerlaeota bacterium]